MRRFLFVLLSFIAANASAEDDMTFHIPSTATISGSSSSTGAKSGVLDVRLMLPKNFWIDVAGNSATDEIDGLQTKTTGGSASVGTDPLGEYAIEGGFDASGVADQYRVQEARLRFTAMPDQILSVSNSGFEVALELRSARFSFANSSNIIYSSSTVQFTAQTERLELAWYGWSPFSFRVWGENAQLDEGFKDLARPLAPVYIPEAAISTGTSWPGQEIGASFGIGKKRWSTRIAGSKKTAAVTGDQTATITLSGDFKWTKSFATALRFSSASTLGDNSSSTTSAPSDPIQTSGLDLIVSF